MRATKPRPGPTNEQATAPAAPAMLYRGKLHTVPTLAEIARHCRQMVWELDANAATVH